MIPRARQSEQLLKSVLASLILNAQHNVFLEKERALSACAFSFLSLSLLEVASLAPPHARPPASYKGGRDFGLLDCVCEVLFRLCLLQGRAGSREGVRTSIL